MIILWIIYFKIYLKKSWFIAKDANAYVASEFNVSTEHLRNVDGEDKQFSVYAVQFIILSDLRRENGKTISIGKRIWRRLV